MSELNETLAKRGNRYGRFDEHAVVTQQLKNVLKYHKNGTPWEELSLDQKEALEMICHKMGRIINGDPNYDDSWMDIAGYAQLVVKILHGEPL